MLLPAIAYAPILRILVSPLNCPECAVVLLALSLSPTTAGLIPDFSSATKPKWPNRNCARRRGHLFLRRGRTQKSRLAGYAAALPRAVCWLPAGKRRKDCNY